MIIRHVRFLEYPSGLGILEEINTTSHSQSSGAFLWEETGIQITKRPLIYTIRCRSKEIPDPEECASSAMPSGHGRKLVDVVVYSWVRILILLRTHGIDGVLYVKSVDAQSTHVGVTWKSGELCASSNVIVVT
ncbi:hypothetical protein TNCV_4683561 [Trichonephila clavipes]|nr:hypothetical protein TNCV_4683561 [Trichonephila clavipes]